MSAAELAGGFELLAATDLPRHLEDHYLQRAGELPEATQRLLLLAAAEPIGDATLVWRAAHSARHRKELARPGRGRAARRGRSPCPLPASAGAIRGVPGGGPFRAASRASGVGGGDRSGYRSRSSGVASCSRGGGCRRGGGRRVGALGRPGAGPWGRGGCCGVPGARGRADPRSGGEGQAGPGRRAGEVRCWRRRTRRSSCWRPPSLPRSTSFSARGWSACARRSRSPAPAAATLRPCCSMPPGASNRSTPRWLARRISRRWRRRCSPVASATDRTSARLPRPLRLRRRHQQPPRAIDLLLDGLATRFTEGYAAGLPPLRKALDAFRDVEGSTAGDVRWLWLACRLAQDLWDDELWYVLATRGVRVARETGALSLLPIAANYLAAFHVHSGAFGDRLLADRRGRRDHASDRTWRRSSTRR